MSYNNPDVVPISQISQYAQSGFTNALSNRVPWRYNLLDGFSESVCGDGASTCNGGCGGRCGNGRCRQQVRPLREEEVVVEETFTENINVTDDILRSVRGGAASVPVGRRAGGGGTKRRAVPRQGAAFAAAESLNNPGGLGNRAAAVSGEYNVYTEGNSELEDLDILARQQGDTACARRIHRMRQLPRFTEPSPGIFSGSYINDILLPDAVSHSVDLNGGIYGGAASSIVQRRIDTLNGFGEAVNNFNYGPAGMPGSFGRPFVKDNFFVTYAAGSSTLWSQRIAQFSSRPDGYTGPTGPNGPIDTETQGLALSVNGMVGRVIYLIRRKQPYYFHFQSQLENCNLPCDIERCALQKFGMYFSTDCIGGGTQNYINNIGNIGTVSPPVFPGTTVLLPSATMWITVTESWPDLLFLNSVAGPCMGMMVIVLGHENC